MSARETLLVIGPDSLVAELAGRLLLINYRGQGALDREAIQRVSANTVAPLRVALVAAELADGALLRALPQILPLRPEGDVTLVAVGPPPDEATRTQLRSAGVSLALWEPFSDEELRFVVNHAQQSDPGAELRSRDRVPANLLAHVASKTGERTAVVYNLSATGAYLVTPRPAMRGGQVQVRLTLPGGETILDAQVAWNNVPGNLRRANAPVGMGVRFSAIDAETLEALRIYVKERTAHYRL